MKRWTNEEVDYLISYSIDPDNEKIRDVAIFLNRSEASIKNKLKRLRKEKEYTRYVQRRWTPKEQTILKEAVHYMTYKEISGILGRTENSVMLRAQRLGLSKKVTSKEIIEVMERKVRILAKKGYTRREISEEVGVPYIVIKNFIHNRRIECSDASKIKTKEQRERHNNFIKIATRRK